MLAAALPCCAALRFAVPMQRSLVASPRSGVCAPLLPGNLQRKRIASEIRMQQVDIDDASKAFYDEYVETDPVTGESKSLSLDEKEKLYLECLDAYYNDGGKQLLSDDEYEKLKLDLDFDGSRIATLSAEEIKFVLSNKRFKMGKPIMSDTEYDALRLKLKLQGSFVVIHDAAKCSLEDGICKNDMRVDDGKTRLLYLPGTVGGIVLACELFFWTLHIDPLLSILLGAVPSYFFGVWFTENIFAQKPLVTQAACPNCGALNTVFFGDLFNVMSDGLAGPPAPPGNTVVTKCTSCKAELSCDREALVISTTVSKVPAK